MRQMPLLTLLFWFYCFCINKRKRKRKGRGRGREEEGKRKGKGKGKLIRTLFLRFLARGVRQKKLFSYNLSFEYFTNVLAQVFQRITGPISVLNLIFTHHHPQTPLKKGVSLRSLHRGDPG